MQTFGQSFVSAGPMSFPYDVFAPEFFEVIGCHAQGVGPFVRPGDRIYLCGEVSDAEAPGFCGKFDHRFNNRPNPRFVDIDTPDSYFTQRRRSRQIVQLPCGNACDIDAMQRIQKPGQDFFQVHDNLGKPIQGADTRQDPGIMNNDLDPENAFAFGITFDGDLPEMDFKDRQVIRRFLDRP